MIEEPRLYPLAFGDTLSTNEWVEFHIHRFLDSSFVARMTHMGRHDAIGAAIILWTAAYKEDPAGTLPDDDILLADKARFRDLDLWREIRPLALYGWAPVLIEDRETGEHRTGRLGHPRVTLVATKSAKRRDGRLAGRDAARLAVMRSRVRAKLLEMGKKSFAENGDLVAQVTTWLDQSSLFVTAENVAAALSTLHNIPRVVSMRDGGGK